MRYLLRQSSHKLLSPAHGSDGLPLTDTFWPVVGVQSELERSVKMLSEQGWIELTPPDKFIDKGSLKRWMTPLRTPHSYSGQGNLGCPKHSVVRPTGSRVMQSDRDFFLNRLVRLPRPRGYDLRP